MVGVIVDFDYVDDVQYYVFGVYVLWQDVIDGDCYCFGFVLQQVLGCQYMVDFVGVDVEGQCVECIVGGGVVVVVDDGYVWLGEFLFWSDYVYDVVVG